MEYKCLSWLLVFFYILHCTSSSVVTEHHNRTICSQCQCLYTISGPFSVDCKTLNFKEIPEIWKDLKAPWRFELDGNSLTEITAFKKLDNLTSLSFKYNMISKIADYAFQNLTNVTSIVLSNNEITGDTLKPDTFKGPYHDKLPYPLPLKTLNLSNNKINRLQKGVFHPLINLTSLDLSHNPLVDFSTKTAEAFSELTALQILDLSYTKLQRLPSHFFAELSNLQTLDLSGNNFIAVPAEVNYAKTVRSLFINDNLFGRITADAFWESLDKLETLKLSNSGTLSIVDNGAFGNLTSLQSLWLNQNPQLSYIGPRAFTSSQNQTLHLKELHLDKNDLESISQDALPWKEIKLLDLEENPWNCDCNFEWFVKEVFAPMERTSYDQTRHVVCASPPELLGMSVTETRVQTHKFTCQHKDARMVGAGVLVIATIVVGTLLLVTGTIIFSYVLFRRTKVSDWIGDHVKYRRTQNEDEEVITNDQY